MNESQKQGKTPFNMRVPPCNYERYSAAAGRAWQSPHLRNPRDQNERHFLEDHRDDGSLRPCVDDEYLLRQHPTDRIFGRVDSALLYEQPLGSYPECPPYGIAPSMTYMNPPGNEVPLYRPGYGVPPYSPYPQHSAFHGYPQYPWGVLHHVEYVTNIQPSDVLSGRGGATNSHSGNRAFRTLIQQYKNHYLRAKKKDKPAVAAAIVQRIRETDGRFLKRVDKVGTGQVLWVDIGDEKAKEKTCQALREGAPEIRRTRNSFSADREDRLQKQTSRNNESSPSSSSGRYLNCWETQESRSASETTKVSRKALKGNDVARSYCRTIDMFIRPIPVMVEGRACPDSFSVEQLQPDERELYLLDFIPPDSSRDKFSSPTDTLSFHQNSNPSAEEGFSILSVANV